MTPTSPLTLLVHGQADSQRTFLGQLTYDCQARRSTFQWSEEALSRDQQWSPVFLPVSEQRWVAGNREQELSGLPGLVHDALPDGWGLLLMDRTWAPINKGKMTAMQRLAFLGNRCWGALSFSDPAMTLLQPEAGIDISLSSLVRDIDGALEGDQISRALLLGGSVAHGARPKVMVAVSDDLTQALVGQEDLPPGYRHVLIKFAGNGEDPSHPAFEFCYTEAARGVGIDTAPAALIEARGRAGLCVDRFDRVDGQRRHVHSMAGMLHTTHRIANSDWLHVADILSRVEGGQADLAQAFRRAVFNAVFCVRDDHTKNIAFMRRGNTWGLSPAFDIAYCDGPGGYHTMTYAEHQGRDVRRADLIRLAGPFGVSEPDVDRLVEQMRGQRELMLKEARSLGVAKPILAQAVARFKGIDKALKPAVAKGEPRVSKTAAPNSRPSPR